MAGNRERGTVIAASGGTVDVRVQATDACENCAACCRVDSDGVLVEGARNRVGASVGDTVEVEIPAGADVRAGVIVFLVPAAGLLVGYALGAAAATALGLTADLGGAIGAVASVVVALLVLRARGRTAPDERFRPIVRAIIAPASSGPSVPESGQNDTPHDTFES